MVLMIEIHSLHQIAQCLDHNQTCFYDMLMSLKDNLSSNQKDSDHSLMTELVIREKNIVDLNQQLAETNQVVADLIIRGRNLSAPILENSGIPSTQFVEKGKKIEGSARVDDPDQFFDEVGKDMLDFDAWRLGVEARLRDNADWFPTTDHQINYIMRRLAGKPSRETKPFLKSSKPERFTSATSMLDHLEAQYGDPDRKRKAEDEWDKLRMIDPESYGNKYNAVSYIRFGNAFFRPAAELQKPRSEWKLEFEHRISPTFQKA